MRFEGMKKIVVCIKDMDESLKFYCDVLGFIQLSRVNLPEMGMELAALDAGNDFVVELVHHFDFPEERYVDGTIEMLGIHTDNFMEDYQSLKAAGVQFESDKPFPGSVEGNYFIFFRGPSGERIELFQGLA